LGGSYHLKESPLCADVLQETNLNSTQLRQRIKVVNKKRILHRIKNEKKRKKRIIIERESATG